MYASLLLNCGKCGRILINIYCPFLLHHFEDLLTLQYTMLTGKPPFQGQRCDDDAAADITQRIKGGQFRMDTEEWDVVSDEAKKLIKGLTLLHQIPFFFH